jgi:phosphohistidine swiveling domain-containing protein
MQEQDRYPSFTEACLSGPVLLEAVKYFDEAVDSDHTWHVDYHMPVGVSPMGFTFLEDCFSWGSQLAAQRLSLPHTAGTAIRLLGTHVYKYDIDISNYKLQHMRSGAYLSSLNTQLEDFPRAWEASRTGMRASLAYHWRRNSEALEVDELISDLFRARVTQRLAWEDHFFFRYLLLGNYQRLEQFCADLGVHVGIASKMTQGAPTALFRRDCAVEALAHRLTESDLDIIESLGGSYYSVDDLADYGVSPEWIRLLNHFLDEHGWQMPSGSDPTLAPWNEDPRPLLDRVVSFASNREAESLEALLGESQETARRVTTEIRHIASTQGVVEEFDSLLRSNLRSNYAWWSEDHNYFIELQASIPLRLVCQKLSDKLGFSHRDDLLFLFWPELIDLLIGNFTIGNAQRLIADRRSYYARWANLRSEIPKVLGARDDKYGEIFLDLHGKPLKDGGVQLRGSGLVGGLAEGRVRVLYGAEDGVDILPGEIIVCEAMTANWFSAAERAIACVSEIDGPMSHTSIICRELNIPYVGGVEYASQRLSTGDYVLVDGSEGLVYRREK